MKLYSREVNYFKVGHLYRTNKVQDWFLDTAADGVLMLKQGELLVYLGETKTNLKLLVFLYKGETKFYERLHHASKDLEEVQ